MSARLSVFAGLLLASTPAFAQDLTISFPSNRPYYSPSSGMTIAFPYGMTAQFPGSWPMQVGGSGLAVAEIPGGMVIDMPNGSAFELGGGSFPAIDLGRATGTTIEFPVGSTAWVVFPYSGRAPVPVGDGGGLTLTNYGNYTRIDFPGTNQSGFWLGYWEYLPRIELPSGGSVVVETTAGEQPPVDLGGGAGLTVDIPTGDTQTFWFDAVGGGWNAWY